MTTDTTPTLNTPGLFVYGTLLPGSYNEGLMLGAASVPATVKGHLYLASEYANFPVLVTGEEGIVLGAYFPGISPLHVPDVTHMELSTGYHLEWVEVFPGGGDPTHAWTFAWAHSTGPLIESGDFAEWESAQKWEGWTYPES